MNISQLVTSNKNFLIVGLIVLTIFIGLRALAIKDNLLFYNDMGRDYNVLLDWAESGKPPLLGPQTSVVSYNQSAWYFYFLFPIFFISNFSALSSTVTIIIFGSFTILFLLWLTLKSPYLFRIVTITALLLAVHPQVVYQNRFVWNPSFLPYFLFTSIVSLLLLKQHFKPKLALLFWFSLAFAVGFSYSAAPLAIGLSLYLLIIDRQHLKHHLIFALMAAFIVLLPTIVFEMRHAFTLTKLFITGQTTAQEIMPLAIRFDQLQQLLLPAISSNQNRSLALFSISGLVIGSAFAIYEDFNHRNTTILLLSMASLYLVLQLLLPINIEKHYIFPVLLLVFMAIAALPQRWAVSMVSFLVLYWSQPFFIQNYISQPIRSIADMESCYQKLCQNRSEPLYVSMDSGILAGYHNAPEHRFFMRKAGCNVKDIEKTQTEASTMAVVNDSTRFTPGKSGYRELTLFGEYSIGEELACTENLSVTLIHKPSTNTPADSILQPQ